MSKLERWLDAPSELDGEELRLLRAGGAVEPPRGMADEVWSGLALQVGAPLAAQVSSAAADAAATSGAGAAAPSIGGAGAAVSGAAGGVGLAAGGALGSTQVGVVSATLTQIVAAPLALGALAGSLLMGGALLVREPGLVPAPASLASAQLRSGSPPSAQRAQPAPAEVPRGLAGPLVDQNPRPLATGVPSDPRAAAPGAKAEQQQAVMPGAEARREAPRQPDVLPSSRAEFPPVAEGAEADGGPPRAAASPAAPVNAEQRHAAAQAESRAIAESREALRSGNVEAALSTLDRARWSFPDGILRQEREALTIEALVRSGQRASARARAAAFLAAYPRSPHAAQVRRVVGLE